MKHNYFPKAVVTVFIIVLALSLTALNWEGTTGRLVPTGVVPVDGSWTGTTSRSHPMSFSVSSNGTQWSTFSLHTNFTVTTCAGVTGSLTINVPGPGSITNGEFVYSSTKFSFTGQFDSINSATGTYSFNNYSFVIGIPYPPYIKTCYFSQSGTWSSSVPLLPPVVFAKISPNMGAISQWPLGLILSWGNSSNAVSYEYCIDTVNNDACDTNWVSTGAIQSATLDLSYSTNYYWQIRAVNLGGTTYADSGTWWLFTTAAFPPPGAFSKTSPANVASGVAINPTLSWGTSSGAASYEYCYATTTGCTSWTSVGTATSVGLSGLFNNQIYYWQVRAVNTGGNTLADTGLYWSFTTANIYKIYLPLVIR